MSLTPIGTESGCELYCEPHLEGYADGEEVPSLPDHSGHNRHLSTTKNQPIFKTGILNGKSVIRFNGSTAPLLYTPSIFKIACGWIVAKYNGATFSNYAGLLSDALNIDILTGNIFDTKFYDFGYSKFEYRADDRIYRSDNAVAPMEEFKVIFFRFWNPIVVGSIQLGQQRDFTDRRWIGDIAFLSLYSINFHEEEIRHHSKTIADNFGLTLADVYPYLADIKGAKEEPEHNVNFYDPPEGDRISETISASKRSLELTFTAADQEEIDTFLSIYNSHYSQGLPIIYKDYRFTPPRDFEGYFDSAYEISGENNDFSYGFKLREK